MDELPSASRGVRVYVDMVGDLFHAGHVELLRAARDHGDQVVVGVLSEESAASYKRRPILSLAERVAVVEACRWVDEVIPDAPLCVDAAFLRQHRIDLVVHGDDLTEEAARDVYGAAIDAGVLRLVPRCGPMSTSEIVRRIRERSELGEDLA